MRTAKVPKEIVNQKVWESLCRRMDPATHRVRPSWLTMMREIGVCRQRIAEAVRNLKERGKLMSIEVQKPGSDGKVADCYYEIVN